MKIPRLMLAVCLLTAVDIYTMHDPNIVFAEFIMQEFGCDVDQTTDNTTCIDQAVQKKNSEESFLSNYILYKKLDTLLDNNSLKTSDGVEYSIILAPENYGIIYLILKNLKRDVSKISQADRDYILHQNNKDYLGILRPEETFLQELKDYLQAEQSYGHNHEMVDQLISAIEHRLKILILEKLVSGVKISHEQFVDTRRPARHIHTNKEL